MPATRPQTFKDILFLKNIFLFCEDKSMSQKFRHLLVSSFLTHYGTGSLFLAIRILRTRKKAIKVASLGTRWVFNCKTFETSRKKGWSCKKGEFHTARIGWWVYKRSKFSYNLFSHYRNDFKPAATAAFTSLKWCQWCSSTQLKNPHYCKKRSSCRLRFLKSSLRHQTSFRFFAPLCCCEIESCYGWRLWWKQINKVHAQAGYLLFHNAIRHTANIKIKQNISMMYT